ncbi:hypothetical protein [Azospirillum palustre]
MAAGRLRGAAEKGGEQREAGLRCPSPAPGQMSGWPEQRGS